MAAAAILDFQKFEIFSGISRVGANLHQCAKCHHNRSIGCAEMADLTVFTMAAVRHLGV